MPNSPVTQRSGDNQIYWGIQLDQDLLETIITFYPEWFRDYNLNLTTMADWNVNNTNGGSTTRNTVIPLSQSQDSISSQNTEVDEDSLQKSMDKNKESLKKKLLERRPVSQLIEQGIMPPLNTPPSFHMQRQKLERAKISNILKKKIQYRPDCQKLVHQHILEGITIDPSLQEKQKQLKKARLADNLNNRISRRPGPLELIKGNILHADERLTQAIKEGQITFRKTCEGKTIQNNSPQFKNEEDSSSDETPSSPQETSGQLHNSFPSLDTGETSPILESPNSNKTTSLSSPGSSPLSLCAVSTPCSPTTNSVTASPCHGQNKDSVSTSRSRKKSKSKFQPKTRTIKFHEYKGPPSAQKNHTVPSSPVETTYELLLQQQQLLLQWQLEWRHKYPQIVVPSGFPGNLSSGKKPGDDQTPSGKSTPTQLPASQNNQFQCEDNNNSTPKLEVSKLEDMKVSDLKAELKRRNLPVSGPKPQLIERLKTYSNVTPSTATASSFNFTNVSSTVNTSSPAIPVSLIDNMLTVLQYTTDHDINLMSPVETVTNVLPALPSTESKFEIYQVSNEVEPSLLPPAVPMDTDIKITLDSAEEDIVNLQQKRIRELQLELQRSQLQLHQQQGYLQTQSSSQIVQADLNQQSDSQDVSCSTPAFTTVAATCTVATSEAKPNQRQLLQQHLQQKLQRQQQPLGASSFSNDILSAAVKANLASFLHTVSTSTSNVMQDPAMSHTVSPSCTSVTSSIQQPVVSFPSTFPHVTAGFLCPSTSVMNDPVSTTAKPRASSLPNGLIDKRKMSVPTVDTRPSNKPLLSKKNSEPPPDYDEATKQLNKNHSYSASINNFHTGLKSFQSQAVNDVLEILIQNGELPPSAAQEPYITTIPQSFGKSHSSTFPVITSSSAVSVLTIPPSLSLVSQETTPIPCHPTIASPPTIGSTTSPPSTMLSETGHDANPSLDFDLHLDLDGFGGMELDGFGLGEERRMELNNCYVQKSAQVTTWPTVTLHDSGMDTELTEWLDSMMPITGTAIPSNTESLYNGPNDHDPLLSTMCASHDPFEEMDCKTPTLMWDFAT
ncbi:uncharacterized protein LOC143224718 isoform X2 [Tachypleus tridentatus]|uniref:uncharacterized protein LOC143224718 isoform X2 n=1 Tax=Tachypleus tridentatus TaxID=6853 RepID=UPI003FCEFE06